MKRIGVTGGAGFIGSNLLRTLSLDENEVIVVDDLTTGKQENLEGLSLKFIQGSITNKTLLEKVFANADVVVHLAARGSVPRSIEDPVATHDVNVKGTLNVLETCRQNNSHLIFTSSSSVYGSNIDLPKNEKMWMRPLSPYAASKLSGESFVNSYITSYGMRSTALRLFNVFGPLQRPDHEYAAVLPKWIWKAINGEEIELHGDGSQTRDFTYVKNVCEVINFAIFNNVYDNGFINLAFGNKISLLEVIELLRLDFPDLKVKKLESRLGDVRDSQNDPSKLLSLFPDIRSTSFEQGFKETVAWLKGKSKN